MKHGLFYTLLSWILDRYGYHLSKNPPKGAERKQKGLPTADLFVGGERGPVVPERGVWVNGEFVKDTYPVAGE